jgi:predicted O-methyltransferase YrrM
VVSEWFAVSDVNSLSTNHYFLKAHKSRKFISSLLYFRGVKNIFLPLQYLAYRIKAKGAHGIHSPFVFELFHKVICESPDYYDFPPIEHLRKRLLTSKEAIEVIDFGARGEPQTSRNEFGTGSKGALKTRKRKIKNIVRKSAIPEKEGRLLFRLVNFVQPQTMVEMGTSLGISTLYQHKARPEAKMIAMEGSPETSTYAGMNFKIFKDEAIERVVGDFAETLPQVLKNLTSVDYVFFDGNHRKEATLEYFQKFLPLASAKCVFVFDDIRWSTGMHEAWKEIIKEPKATVTVDLFSFGLVFFNPTQVKQHFVLRNWS